MRHQGVGHKRAKQHDHHDRDQHPQHDGRGAFMTDARAGKTTIIGGHQPLKDYLSVGHIHHQPQGITVNLPFWLPTAEADRRIVVRQLPDAEAKQHNENGNAPGLQKLH